MTKMVSVLEIMRTATESVDFGTAPTDPDENAKWWENIIKVKAADTGFGALVDSILRDGFDHNQPIGWYVCDNTREISEGHHRLVAAILLGMDEVPTSPFGGGHHGEICAHCDCTEYESYSVFV